MYVQTKTLRSPEFTTAILSLKKPTKALLRNGQLNRHTRYRPATTVPHETLPRSGRATRWTNTPVRIFKDRHY